MDGMVVLNVVCYSYLYACYACMYYHTTAAVCLGKLRVVICQHGLSYSYNSMSYQVQYQNGISRQNILRQGRIQTVESGLENKGKVCIHVSYVSTVHVYIHLLRYIPGTCTHHERTIIYFGCKYAGGTCHVRVEHQPSSAHSALRTPQPRTSAAIAAGAVNIRPLLVRRPLRRRCHLVNAIMPLREMRRDAQPDDP